MKAVIVAAGLGKRLLPHTKDTPKPLIKIRDKTILEYQIENLRRHGIDEIVLVIGHHDKKVKEFIKNLDLKTIKVTFVTNPFFATTNDMASLWFAKEYVRGEEFIYIHGDLFNHPDLIEKCLKTPGDIVLAVDKENFDEESMKVKVENNRILESSKKIPLNEAYGEWIGIIKFTPKGGEMIFNEIDDVLMQGNFDVYDTFVLTRLAKKGHKIDFCNTDGLPWVEIDFPKDLEKAKTKIYPKLKDIN